MAEHGDDDDGVLDDNHYDDDDDDDDDNHDDDEDEEDDDDGGGDDDGKFVCLPLNLSPHLAKSETPIVASITKTDILLSSAFHLVLAHQMIGS